VQTVMLVDRYRDTRMASVDVVVPCYQYGRFLRECVSSVLTQGAGEVRVLIIDNASTDDTADVARQLAAEDKRVQVVVNPRNIGATRSYNMGVEWASAEYFLLLDADDLLAPGCLARALAIMEAHPELSFTYGFEALLFPDGTIHEPKTAAHDTQWQIVSGQEFVEHLCRTPRNHVGAPTVLRRTTAQKRAGFYRPELPYSDDMEMWLRLAMHGSVGGTATVQGIRRVHASQMSSIYRNSMVRDFGEREAAMVSFFSNEGRESPQSEQLVSLAKRRLGEHAYWSAASHLCRGYFKESLHLFKYAITRRPSAAIFPPIGWLLQMERPFGRFTDVLAEAFGRLKTSAKRTTA
jgi:glycosyltransferase involved in cell wall biosynthesis